MNWAEWARYVALSSGVVAGVFLGYKEYKERRARAGGLPPNPTRCEDHETWLRIVEATCLYMSPQIANIEKDVSEIREDVKQLVKMHMKK